MLQDLGATPLRCPLVAILDAPDPAPVETFLRQLAAGHFDDLILLTGEGLRRLLGVARRAGVYDQVVAALPLVRTIVRGPKPAKALTEIGLRPDLAAEAPTTEGVIATLAREQLVGRRVAVQLYGQDPNERLISFLQKAGATVTTVAPYVYAPASADAAVADLIRQMAAGAVDVIAFTSASQVERIWSVAAKHHLEDALPDAFTKTHVAAVGPIVAGELAKRAVRVEITPARNFFMKPLVNLIVAALAG
jgi:uroporphyrinogen-III synthase